MNMDESTTYGRSHVKPNSQNAATNIDRSFESKSGIAYPKTQNSMQTLSQTHCSSATVVCQTKLPSPDSTKTQSWEARKPHWENPPNEKPPTPQRINASWKAHARSIQSFTSPSSLLRKTKKKYTGRIAQTLKQRFNSDQQSFSTRK